MGRSNMATPKQSSFQNALDAVEALPDNQKHDLIEVVRRRLTENRRVEIAKNIHQAKSEFKSGKVRRGSLADLLKELKS